MDTVGTRFAGVNGILEVVLLGKVQFFGIKFQKFLSLVHVHGRNHSAIRGFQVLGVIARNKALELDAVFASDKEQLAHLQVLAKFSCKFSAANVVGMAQFVPANRRNDRHKLFCQKLFKDVPLDPLNPARAHIVYAIDNTKAPGQNPVSLYSAEAASRQVAHNPLSNTQRRLLDKGQGLFTGKPHATLELGLDFPSFQLGVDAVAGPRHYDNANARLVQKRNVPHKHGEQRVVH